MKRPAPAGRTEIDPFWRHAARHEFAYQRCRTCHRPVFYVRAHCPHCGGLELDVLVSAGLGRIYSYTVIRMHPEPVFAARVPYAVAIVDLDEGIRVVAEVSGDPDQLEIGSRVGLTWDDDSEIPIPVFAPREG